MKGDKEDKKRYERKKEEKAIYLRLPKNKSLHNLTQERQLKKTLGQASNSNTTLSIKPLNTVKHCKITICSDAPSLAASQFTNLCVAPTPKYFTTSLSRINISVLCKKMPACSDRHFVWCWILLYVSQSLKEVIYEFQQIR